MKTKYIVYFHHTVLGDVVVNCYSPAEAKYIVEARMKKKGLFDPGVDRIITEKEEQKLNTNRDFHGGPGYGY
ncbi:MAG TPA: hypothetical protein ENH85_12040 [Candidatus Scalindua sp.]|nr:hypothetical protein [Candidatus Scalindua sp.]